MNPAVFELPIAFDLAGLIAIACALTMRVLSIFFNLKTRTFYAPRESSSPPPAAP